jgi:hypothetical protein
MLSSTYVYIFRTVSSLQSSEPNFVRISHVPHAQYIPRSLILLKFGEGYKL